MSFAVEYWVRQKIRPLLHPLCECKLRPLLKVIAEGVETREQLEFLRDLHCDEAQDYHISSPLPALGISEVLRGGSILLTSPLGRRPISARADRS